MKPPSFIESGYKQSDSVSASGKSTSNKKALLLYVDVNVTPTKTGRIGIYEGDDLRVVARNFSKTFSLNRAKMEALHRHLELSF